MLKSLCSAIKRVGSFYPVNVVSSNSLLNQTTFPKVQNLILSTQKNYCSNPLLGKKYKIFEENNNRNLLRSTCVPQLDLYRSAHIDKKYQNIKFSLNKGKRKTNFVVVSKFYRLNWGCWIRGKAGRTSGLYAKSAPRRRRLQQHVMTNASQSWLLDKMVTAYWRKPRHYVDDPYEPYHSREEFRFTRLKPWDPTIYPK